MKRLISALLAIFTIATLICVPVVATEATETTTPTDTWFAHRSTSLSGSGTQADPYLITCAEDLAYVAYACNYEGNTFSGKYFLQTADIDLGAHIWIPIGGAKSPANKTTYFVGNYDGNYKTIKGMTITDSSFATSATQNQGQVALATYDGGAGLFGRLGHKDIKQNQIIKNLALVESSITTTASLTALYFIGGIVGQVNQPITFENLYTDVTIQVNTPTAGIMVGGVIGGIIEGSINGSSSITNCVSAGSITLTSTQGGMNIGGFVGKWTGGSHNKNISGCYYTGAIQVQSTGTSGNARVGGFVGHFGDNKSIIQNSHMYGTVAGTTQGTNHIGLVAGFWNVIGTEPAPNSTYYKPTANTVENTATAAIVAGSAAANSTITGGLTAIDAPGKLPFDATGKFLATGIALRWAQERMTGDTMDVRFLGTGVIPAETEAGFKVTAKLDNETVTTDETIKVMTWESITADTKTYAPADLGGNAGDKILGLVITDVPTEGVVTFIITPYVGESTGRALTIVYTNGVLTGCN